MARKNLKTFKPMPPAPEWEGTHKLLAEVISEQMGIDSAEVTKDATFIDDLGFDSLDAIEVIMQLEEQLAIEIDEEPFMDLKTVGEMLLKLDAVVAERMKSKK